MKQRIILLVCILSGVAAVAPPPAAGQGAGDFGSGYGTKFIYRRPFRYDLDTLLLDSLIQAKAPGGSGGRTYLDSYSGGTADDGYGRIDSTGALYLIQFPNFDSESFGGAANFANVGNDNDSSRFPLNGAQVLYQWTYPVYLDRVELIVQWGSGAGKNSYSITGLPPLGVDSGLVVHFRTQGGGAVKDRWIRFYRRAVARGYSFVLADPHLVFLHEIQVTTLTGGTWPTAGTSVQMLIRLRARRKHL